MLHYSVKSAKITVICNKVHFWRTLSHSTDNDRGGWWMVWIVSPLYLLMRSQQMLETMKQNSCVPTDPKQRAGETSGNARIDMSSNYKRVCIDLVTMSLCSTAGVLQFSTAHAFNSMCLLKVLRALGQEFSSTLYQHNLSCQRKCPENQNFINITTVMYMNLYPTKYRYGAFPLQSTAWHGTAHFWAQYLIPYRYKNVPFLLIGQRKSLPMSLDLQHICILILKIGNSLYALWL